MNRVVVTGMGIISPLGNTIPDFWKAIKNGRNGISKISSFNTSDYPVHIAGQVNIDLSKYLDHKSINKIDRFTAFSLIASEQAMKDSQLNLETIDQSRSGVIIGSGIGGMLTFEEQHSRLLNNPRRVSPFFIPSMIPDIASGYVSLKYGFKGVNYAVVSACASSSHSIGDAFRNIKHGYSDIIIAGGAEAGITPMAIAGFSNMKALTKNEDYNSASKPFDLNRNGFVIGEGARILILESLDHALNRKAKIYAEIKGFGASADAHHITSPHPEGKGAIQAMKNAIDEANLNIEDIKYINAHGTSTKHNDLIETKAIKSVFGKHSKKLFVSSTKSMVGHLLGASGALEAIASILSIKKSIITPTINYTDTDPQCDLNYVPNESIDQVVENTLSNSFGFGGHNSVLAISKYNK
jgi:3-oxoacyl-[acyl-carrier-protein] synthase II